MMRKYILALCLSPIALIAQNQNVGIGTSNPDASAVLDLNSSDKGLLIPRISLTDVSNTSVPVNSPQTGLLVWNTNNLVIGGNGIGFYFFNGTQWTYLSEDPKFNDLFDNHVPFYDAASNTFKNSRITQNGSRVGINNSTPSSRLNVRGGTQLAENAAIEGENIMPDTKGYLGIHATNDFDGYLDLDIYDKLIGVLGIANNVADSTNNIGVYGYSSGTAGVFSHKNGNNKVELAKTDVSLEVQSLPSLLAEVADVEQTQYNGTFGSAHPSIWQSFTATKTGLLTKIQVRIKSPSSTPGTVYIGFVLLQGSGLGGTAMFSFNRPINNQSFEYIDFTFSTPQPVVAGQTYTFNVVRSATSNLQSYLSFGLDPYAGGQSSVSTQYDLQFRTFVEEQLPIENTLVVKDGAVGIGSEVPSSKLDVNGDLNLTDELRLSGNAGNTGEILVSQGDGASPIWAPVHNASSIWGINGGYIYAKLDERIGVGTSFPNYSLHLRKKGHASIGLESNYDLNGNNDNPFIEFKNRQNATQGIIGINNLVDRDPDNNTVTGGLFHQSLLLSSNSNASGMQFATASNVQMTILNNGNIGIGTNAPAGKLDVTGGRVEFTSTTDATGSVGTGVLEIGNSLRLDNNEIITNTNTTLLLQYDNGGDLSVSGGLLYVDDSQHAVGIGTTTPSKGALEVAAKESRLMSNYGYLNSLGGTGITVGPVNRNISIYADDRIAAIGFIAHSDRRIKTITGLTNSTIDLNTLMQIEVTNYYLTDTIQNGRQDFKKVIAQQVDEVYPLAVQNKVTEIVPDIFQKAQISNNWIVLKTDLKPGERVKIITEASAEVYEVVEVDSSRFKVRGLSVQPSTTNSTVFVYGREVNDFHTVDYEAIAMLNVSATQEQQKLIEALQKKNAQLELKLNKSVENTAAIKAELEEIKSLLNTQLVAINR